MEDVNKCIEALQRGDPETLDRTAGAVRGRVARVDNVVLAEMDNYEPGPYTETVHRAIHMMRESSELSLLHVNKFFCGIVVNLGRVFLQHVFLSSKYLE